MQLSWTIIHGFVMKDFIWMNKEQNVYVVKIAKFLKTLIHLLGILEEVLWCHLHHPLIVLILLEVNYISVLSYFITLKSLE